MQTNNVKLFPERKKQKDLFNDLTAGVKKDLTTVKKIDEDRRSGFNQYKAILSEVSK